MTPVKMFFSYNNNEKVIEVPVVPNEIQIPSKDAKTSVIVSKPKSDCSIRKIPLPNEIFCLLEKAKRRENTYFLTGMSRIY